MYFIYFYLAEYLFTYFLIYLLVCLFVFSWQKLSLWGESCHSGKGQVEASDCPCQPSKIKFLKI